METLKIISAREVPTLYLRYLNTNVNKNPLSAKAYYTIRKGHIKQISWCCNSDDIMLKNFCSDIKFKKLKYQDHERNTRDLEYKSIIGKDNVNE